MRDFALVITIAILASAAGLTGCDGAAPGHFTVEFAWPDGAPASFEGLYLAARVEERAVPSERGRVLSDAKPKPLNPDGSVDLSLPQVPNGDDRVVIAELRSGPEATDTVLYYGRSEPFTVAAGEDVTVSVALHLRTVPNAGTAGVAIVVDGAPAEVPQLMSGQVRLRLTTDTGVRARLASSSTFPAGQTTTVTLADLAAADAPEGLTAWELDWDLDAGQPTCGSNFCERQVFVRFADAEGYESETFTARAVVDAVSPGVVPDGVTIDPPFASGVDRIEVSVTFDEPLARAPAVWVVGHEADFPLEVSFPGANDVSSTYTFLSAQTAGALGTSGSFEIRATAADRAGNEAADLPLGSFELDPEPPVIGDLEVVTPTPGGVVSAADQAAGASITVSFTMSEAPGPGWPRVSVGPHGATCTETAPLAFECVWTLDGTEQHGPAQVAVTAEDGAGNPASPVTQLIAFDFEPPNLTWGSISPEAAPGGATVLLTATFDENLAERPALTGDPALDPARLTAIDGTNASTWTWSYSTTEADGDGTYAIELVASDLAGNPSAPIALGDLVVDGTPPTIGAITIAAPGGDGTLNAAERDAGEPVDVTFTVGEPPGPGYPQVRVGIGLTSACTSDDELTWTCTYTPAGTETDGLKIVTVSTTDAAGNGAERNDAEVLFDFTPPSVLEGTTSVSYVPGPSNPFQTVSAAALGTTVRVTFTTSEPLQGPPSVTASGPADVTLAQAQSAGATWTFQLIPEAPAAVEGTYAVQAAMTDLAGNAATATLDAAAFAVDPTPPGVPDVFTAGQVVYRRMPWGSASTGGNPWFGVIGKAGAFEAGATVLVYDGSDPATATEIGRFTAAANGGLPNGTLDPGDRQVVWVGQADPAGNVSPPVAVQDIAWTASMGGKLPGSTLTNPHRFVERAILGGGLVDPYDVELAGPPHTSAGSGRWTRLFAPPTSTPPGERNRPNVVYDSRRDRIVMHGGASPVGFGALRETWEFDGQSWSLRCGTGTTCLAPESTGIEEALAYDPARGVTVFLMVDEEGNGIDTELWEWDGVAWTQVCGEGTGCVAPTAFGGTQMVYDSSQSRVLILTEDLFVNGTVLSSWDGQALTTLCSGGSGCGMPPLEQQAGATWDPKRERLVLHQYDGTSSATWEFDGEDWDKVCGSGTGCEAPNIYTGELEYADALGVVVMHSAITGTWTWDGTTWEPSCYFGWCTRPNDQYGQGMAWDAARGRMVLFEPFGSGTTWTWNGTVWAKTCASGAACFVPGAREHHDVVWLNSAQTMFMHGGSMLDGSSLTGPWSLDAGGWGVDCGGGWKACNEPAPWGAMAVDEGRGKVVWFGGEGSDQLWEWDGQAWELKCGDGTACSGPTARWGHAMAYDSDRGVVVVQGGCLETTVGDPEACASIDHMAWAWDGQAWSVYCESCGSYPSLFRHTMVYDRERGQLVTYGGLDDLLIVGKNETNLLEPGQVSWPCGGGSNGCAPGYKLSHAFGWDDARKKALLFSGSDQPGTFPEEDLWEWDGATWRKVCDDTCIGPLPRKHAAMAWDPSRRRMVLFGGGGGGVPVGDETWEWDGGADQRPGHVMTVAWPAAGGPSPETCRLDPQACGITAVEVLWAAGGDGDEAGTPVAGTSLLVWARGRWQKVASNAAGTQSPATMTWATADPALIGQLIAGPDEELVVAARPAGPNGTLPEYGKLKTTVAEVTVRYRLEPPCGNGGLEAGEGCDDGNTADGDGCSADCRVEGGTCGDSLLGVGEACDDGVNTSTYGGCAVGCALAPACGDGGLDPGETCDDGNTTDGDGCSATCQAQAGTCGGAVDATAAIDGAPLPTSTVGASNDVQAGCAATGSGEVVYRLTAPKAGRIIAEALPGGDLDPVLSARDTCEDATTELACADDGALAQPRIDFPVSAGQEVYVVVEGFAGDSGDTSLRLLYDSCSEATQVQPEQINVTHHLGTTTGAPDAVASSCGAGSAGEHVYALEFSSPGTFQASLAWPGTSIQGVLSVRRSCGAAATEVACASYSATGGQPSVVFAKEYDEPVYVVVEGVDGSAGSYELSIVTTP